MKLREDYFVPGSHHVCMFCETPIGVLRNGKMCALGNKAHVLFAKRKGGLYIINCCGDCAQNRNFRDQKLLNEVHRNIIKAKKRINPNANADIFDAPLAHFVRRELDVSDRASHIRAYRESLRNAG